MLHKVLNRIDISTEVSQIVALLDQTVGCELLSRGAHATERPVGLDTARERGTVRRLTSHGQTGSFDVALLLPSNYSGTAKHRLRANR